MNLYSINIKQNKCHGEKLKKKKKDAECSIHIYKRKYNVVLLYSVLSAYGIYVTVKVLIYNKERERERERVFRYFVTAIEMFVFSNKVLYFTEYCAI